MTCKSRISTTIFTIFFAVLFIVSFALSGYAQDQDLILYGAASDDCITDVGGTESFLYLVDPDTAQTELIGPIGFDGVTGMAILSRGQLVASARGETGDDPRSAILVRINRASAMGSLIGMIGSSDVEGECGRAPDLTYDATTNTLFATGQVCRGSYLQSINQRTGQGTLIGPYDSGRGNGLAISDEGVLFATVDQNLITLNPNTGEPTLIANLPLDERIVVNALAFHPLTGELFGSTLNQTRDETERSSTLIKINTETGAVTEVGRLPNCFDAIIFGFPQTAAMVPTLSEWGLIAMVGTLGIAGFIVLRRRRVTA